MDVHYIFTQCADAYVDMFVLNLDELVNANAM